MAFPRLMPVLLVHSGALQKSQKFGSWKYVGDVLNAIRIFNEKDVDEVVVLDVDASREKRGPDFALLEQLAGECFMPLAYGGGIGSVQTARDVMKCGVEKVILNSAAWRKPELVSDVASVLGSSSTMVSLDVQKSRGVPRRFDHVSHSVDKKSNLSDDVKAMIAAGAGELLVQSVERDGTMSGPDLQLLRDVAGNLPIPVVYAGGVSSLHDASDIWNLGVSGVAAGAWFVFRGPHRAVLITYPGYDDIVASYSCENR